MCCEEIVTGSRQSDESGAMGVLVHYCFDTLEVMHLEHIDRIAVHRVDRCLDVSYLRLHVEDEQVDRQEGRAVYRLVSAVAIGQSLYLRVHECSSLPVRARRVRLDLLLRPVLLLTDPL